MSYDKDQDLQQIQADVLTTDISENPYIGNLKKLKTDTKVPTKAINALNEQLGNAQESASDAMQRVTALEALTNSGLLPVGIILPYAANGDVPAGWLVCDGSAVSRTAYAALFAALGTLYGEGDGMETFNLPDLTGRFLEGAVIAGTVKEPGLPNITGRAPSGYTQYMDGATGAIFDDGIINTRTWDTNSGPYGYSYCGFNASRSSSIYGAADTVQPAAITVRYIINTVPVTSNTLVNTSTTQPQDDEPSFVILYPNGGSAEAPANVTANQRYTMPNPFPGWYINCQAEIYFKNQWGATHYGINYSTGATQFCYAAQHNDGDIVITTGSS